MFTGALFLVTPNCNNRKQPLVPSSEPLQTSLVVHVLAVCVCVAHNFLSPVASCSHHHDQAID